MFRIVIEIDDIARIVFQCYCRYVGAGEVPFGLTLADVLLQGIRILIPQLMTARYHPEASGIPFYRVQIEGDFYMSDIRMLAVLVPVRITGVVISIASHVVKIVS